MKTLLLLSVLAEEKTPPDAEDVVAGAWGAIVLGGLVIAVALLCWSFARQIRKAKKARDAGVYGDVPKGTDDTNADGTGDTDSAEQPADSAD